MANGLHGIKVNADKNVVLAKLRENRITHSKIVAEAKAGYAEKCAELLRAKLEDVMAKKDKFNERLTFSVPLPEDHTKSYNVAIQMLELSIDATVELDAAQVQNFVMDEWDWKDAFIGNSKMYSATARAFDE